MSEYLDWLLTEACARDQHVSRCVNWVTVGLALGALLVWIA